MLLDPFQDLVSVLEQRLRQLGGVLLPFGDLVLEHLREERAARADDVRDRPLPLLSHRLRIAARRDVERVEGERRHAATADGQAVVVRSHGRADDAGEERRRLNGRQPLDWRVRLLEEHAHVADEIGAPDPIRSRRIREKIRRLRGQRRVRTGDRVLKRLRVVREEIGRLEIEAG